MKYFLLLQSVISFVVSDETTDKFIGDRVLVKTSENYPFTAAILKKGQYLSAGALIHESWVLTGADSLFLLQDSVRLLQIRLGTTNYRKGGLLLPVKNFEIHPMFDDRKPQYDIALCKLSSPVNFNPSTKAIRLEKKRKMNVVHFTVTTWPAFTSKYAYNNKILSTESIKRRRTLTVSHLHPSDEDECLDMLEAYGLNETETLMCLDPADRYDTKCSREVGSPVVYNGILRGVISSWRPDDCGIFKNLVVVNVVSSPDIRSWIHSIVHDTKWRDEAYDDYNEKKAEMCPISDYLNSESPDYEDIYFRHPAM